jgi:antitoxin component YwqK of YwqJK toxin-antitoxin module
MRLKLKSLAGFVLLLTSFCSIPFIGFAQIDMPFFGGATLVLNDVILSDSTGTYYLYDNDTFNVIFISKFDPNDPMPRTYKLYDNNYSLRVKGQVDKKLRNGSDFIKNGIWEEFYPNGNPKIVGFYKDDIAVDYWQHFYDNGYPKITYNFRRKLLNGETYTLLEGPYEYFYPNGQVKILGYYSIFSKIIEKEEFDPERGEMRLVAYPILDSKKSGIWRYYLPSGELAGTETY